MLGTQRASARPAQSASREQGREHAPHSQAVPLAQACSLSHGTSQLELLPAPGVGVGSWQDATSSQGASQAAIRATRVLVLRLEGWRLGVIILRPDP